MEQLGDAAGSYSVSNSAILLLKKMMDFDTLASSMPHL